MSSWRHTSSSGLKSNAVKSSFAMAENVFGVTQSDVDGTPHRLYVDRSSCRKIEWRCQLRRTPLEAPAWCRPAVVWRANRSESSMPTGRSLQDGHVGEIVVQSDCLFDGYYDRPDLTAQVLHDGWYQTGDFGLLADGELYVIGRSKDLIIVAGKNIYPQDVENIVCQHPAIHDGRAVAFGLHNPDLGTEDIVVAAEVEHEEELANRDQIETGLRDAIVAELDVAVRSIYLKPPRWIVKSTGWQSGALDDCARSCWTNTRN